MQCTFRVKYIQLDSLVGVIKLGFADLPCTRNLKISKKNLITQRRSVARCQCYTAIHIMDIKQRLWKERILFDKVAKETSPASMLKRYINEERLELKEIIYYSGLDVKTLKNMLSGKPIRTKSLMRVLLAMKMDPNTAQMLLSTVDSRMSEFSGRNHMYYSALELARYADDDTLFALVDMVKHL